MNASPFKLALGLSLPLGLALSLFFNIATAEGPTPKLPMIDLQQVGVAFQSAQGKTAELWCQDLERRINQIYQGDGIVRLNISGRGVPGYVSGYAPLKKNGQDEAIFSIMVWQYKRTFDFSVKDHTGWTGYSRSLPRGKAPRLERLFTRKNRLRYTTSPKRVALLHKRRRRYRKRPAYRSRVKRHKQFLKAAKAKKARARRGRRRRGGKW